MGTLRHTVSAFVLLLTTLPVPAQFIALPDSAATWTESFWIGPGNPYQGFFYAYDAVSPDTVYNGDVYRKLLTVYSTGGSIYPATYGGALRDNGMGQVYFWDPGAPDPVLLYDFDVLPGDTVQDVQGLWLQDVLVYSVDTIIVNGSARKRIGLACIDQPGVLGAYWIQGIGGTQGLLHTTACPSVSGTGTLVCMTANDTVQYGPNVGVVGDCALLLGRSDVGTDEEAVTIHPNPVEDRLMIQLPDQRLRNALVLAMDGRVVRRAPNVTSHLSVDGLEAGAYLLQLVDAEGKVLTGRFVKR